MNALQVVEVFGAAWADHDLDAALELTTEDCVFDNTGPAPDGTRYVGHDAIRKAWQPIFDDLDSSFEAEETFVAGQSFIDRASYHRIVRNGSDTKPMRFLITYTVKAGEPNTVFPKT